IDLRPDKIFFTGSVSTGQKIMGQASQYLIPVELELGGKDPMIVFKDVDLHRATSGALWGALTASGQACTSVEKVLIQEEIYEDFKNLLVVKALKVKVGLGGETEFEIGPMTTDFQVSVVKAHIEDAIDKGAKLLTGKDWDRKSKLIPPLILDGVNETMLIYQEETFGPVIPLIRFRDEAQAVFMANDSKYGLTASVWSKNMKLAYRVADALKVGGVSINNVMLTEGNPYLPFGGVKNSGFGRFKGKEGFSSFSNIKSIIANTDTNHVEPHWYPFTEKKYGLFDKMTDGLFGKGPFSFLKFVIFGLKLEGHANKVSK
ncbi:MAG: aldehyde dehydrogenase family protein, partial [Bacteriovoracaceae bacterium]